MNIVPNKDRLYSHPHAHKMIILLHHVLVYLEEAVDEAPFGFVSKEFHNVTWIDIPATTKEKYVDYLHRIVSNSGGVYGVWMRITTEQNTQDVVQLTLFLRHEKISFTILVPANDPNGWWVEGQITGQY